ncbi:MAG: acetylglutamate kinase [Candidatus Verstraetearchaeota archaeon]|nr:acetylglutamate kinase [Candidatus Verstraetearchaeota archaeon]
MKVDAVLKLGGSCITVKDKPFTLQEEGLNATVRAVSRFLSGGSKLLLVHGGGSFGHYVAGSLGREGTPYGSREASMIHLAMRLLNSKVVLQLTNLGVPAVGVPAMFLYKFRKNSLECFNLNLLEALLEGSVIPVTHGDVVQTDEGGFQVLSGDKISCHLAEAFHAERVVFAIAVPGIYLDKTNGRRFLKEIKRDKLPEIISRLSKGAKARIDVTGGLAGKLSEVQNLLERCPWMEVYIVSGLDEESVFSALSGKLLRGTLIYI